MAVKLITTSTSMAKIQEYLKGGGTVRFVEGVHNITKTLFMYSNTNIILDEGAVLVRKAPSHIFRGYVNPKINYNYNAVENVTISGGGTLKGDGVKKVGSILGFMHGRNIVIEGINIKGVYKSHAMDLCACKDVTVQHIGFSKRTIDTKKNYKEEIQYDYAMYHGYPYFPKNSKCYNDNHCENIKIIDCNFSDANYCIGTHTETNSTKQHKNLQIINCTANGYVVNGGGIFAKIINVDGVTIKGDKIRGFYRAIAITSCNKFYNGRGKKFVRLPIGKTGCKNVLIEDNIISNASGRVKASGIYVTSQFKDLLHSGITIRNNKLRLNNISAEYDIFVDHAVDVNNVDNDTLLNVRIK